MGSRYANTDEDHKLLYIDANNLYGWAMKEYQPHGGFRCIFSDHETRNGELFSILKGELCSILNGELCSITKEEVLYWEDEHEISFFLEVDLDYPEGIKHKSKNFPFCPEKLFIQDDELIKKLPERVNK
jgi:hypothetical protein